MSDGPFAAQEGNGEGDTAGTRLVGARLWSAWRALLPFEDRLEDDLGAELGAAVVIMWALSRFGGYEGPVDLGALERILDEDLSARLGDELIEDLARMSFALGWAWATTEAHAPLRSKPA